MYFTANQEMQGLQHAGRLAENNNENVPPVAHHQDQHNITINAMPYEFQLSRMLITMLIERQWYTTVTIIGRTIQVSDIN